ncbi:MAG: fumarylacetoacetase [Pseudomonadota bacterium]
MSLSLNHTHDSTTKSWLASANQSGQDFSLQNLPLGVFRRVGSQEPFRGGVAIGDQVLDLRALGNWSGLDSTAHTAVLAASLPALNPLMELGPNAWRSLRHCIFGLMSASASQNTQEALRQFLVPMDVVELTMPVKVGNYTDFYTSLHHAHNVGKLVRPDSPVTPNFHWMPIAYHGRASSVDVGGQGITRPMGQRLNAAGGAPSFGPCERLDYELELGIYIGKGNSRGTRIAAADADSHVFGMCLLNDWSARDIQFWEAVPLGPFLAKNFATSVSPWVVTAEALVPFRKQWQPSPDRPAPLPYLDSAQTRTSGVLDIQLEVWLTTNSGAPSSRTSRLSHTSFSHQHWTVGQMITHHTVGGCNLEIGDLVGTGTVSGPTPEEAGALIELTEAGKRPIRIDAQTVRTFLEDGDEVTLKGWCDRSGFARIGFGECRGVVLPSSQFTDTDTDTDKVDASKEVYLEKTN